jgi:hypothetical protein
VNGGWPKAHSRPVCQEAIEQRCCRDLVFIYCDRSSEASYSSKGYCTCIVAGWQRYGCRSGSTQQLARSIAQQYSYCNLWLLFIVVFVCSACCAGPCAPNRPQLDSWLHNMLHTHFFTPCQLHKEHKKNEATYFCADCGVSSTPLCGHCISQHAGHRVIQV